jgi:hypothetical protein
MTFFERLLRSKGTIAMKREDMKRADRSKRSRCKACEDPRNEAYEPYAAVIPPTRRLAGGKEPTAADGPFSEVC